MRCNYFIAYFSQVTFFMKAIPHFTHGMSGHRLPIRLLRRRVGTVYSDCERALEMVEEPGHHASPDGGS